MGTTFERFIGSSDMCKRTSNRSGYIFLLALKREKMFAWSFRVVDGDFKEREVAFISPLNQVSGIWAEGIKRKMIAGG